MNVLPPSGFAERLRSLRVRHHWTQEQLAEKVDVSVATINRWEGGKASPRPEQRRRICDALGAEGHDLFAEPVPYRRKAAVAPEEHERVHQLVSGSYPPRGALALDDSPFWNVGFVRDLRLGEPALKQGKHPIADYFERSCFTQVREAVRAAASEGSGGATLFGLPMVGKTRMALEALRREAPGFLLVPWPRQEFALSALNRFARCPVALVLDDLHELAHQQDAGRILAAMQRLLALAERLIVIVTSRSGVDEAATRQHYDGLIESLGLVTVRIAPMARDEGEAEDFLTFVRMLAEREPARQFVAGAFDGTPGSVLLGLGRRTSQLRSSRFPSAAKAILKAIALLRAADIYDYGESRVRRVAQDVFELTGAQWSDALDYLVGGGWVSLDDGDQSGESRLYVPSDAYLDICLAESGVYPRSQRRITSDFPKVCEALARAPVDSAALFALSRAIFAARREIGAKWNELGVDAAKAGLVALDPVREPVLWARGQYALGISYWKRWRGDTAENAALAVAALEAAQTVLTRAAHPAEWASIQVSLGAAYLDGVLEPKDDLLERGIACYQAALDVYARETFPYEWARAHNNLALAFVTRARGDRAANLEQAITHFRLALHVITRQAYAASWAVVMRNLADAYAQRATGNATENEELAVACCQAVLDDAMRETSPYDWARTHAVVGDIYRQRRSGERAVNLRSAIAHYKAALGILIPGEYDADRAKVLTAQEEARVLLARDERTDDELGVAPSSSGSPDHPATFEWS